MFRIGTTRLVLQYGANARLIDEAQIDLASIEIDATDLYRYPIS